ncbi:MAG: hypothetical protein ACYDB7_04865 [Mycobacteriales bacterium]
MVRHRAGALVGAGLLLAGGIAGALASAESAARVRDTFRGGGVTVTLWHPASWRRQSLTDPAPAGSPELLGRLATYPLHPSCLPLRAGSVCTAGALGAVNPGGVELAITLLVAGPDTPVPLPVIGPVTQVRVDGLPGLLLTDAAGCRAVAAVTGEQFRLVLPGPLSREVVVGGCFANPGSARSRREFVAMVMGIKVTASTTTPPSRHQ